MLIVCLAAAIVVINDGSEHFFFGWLARSGGVMHSTMGHTSFIAQKHVRGGYVVISVCSLAEYEGWHVFRTQSDLH